MDAAASTVGVLRKHMYELRDDIKRLGSIADIVVGFASLLFSEGTVMDPAEVSELVAEIEEIDKERKEVNRRICGLVTKVTGLFCSTSHLRYREITAVFDFSSEMEKMKEMMEEMEKVVSEVVSRTDLIVQSMTAHCSSLLAGMFEMTFEE